MASKVIGDISTLHPSRYLSCDDLKGRTITVKIASVEMEPVQMSDGSEEDKVIVRFEKVNKDFIGGKTNNFSLAVLLSRRPTEWVGKRVVLMPGVTTFGNDVMSCIRIGGSPDATPVRAKAFDQARAKTATVDLKKQAKRFMRELKQALSTVDPIKVTNTVAVPALDPEPAEEKTATSVKKNEDAFGALEGATT